MLSKVVGEKLTKQRPLSDFELQSLCREHANKLVVDALDGNALIAQLFLVLRAGASSPDLETFLMNDMDDALARKILGVDDERLIPNVSDALRPKM